MRESEKYRGKKYHEENCHSENCHPENLPVENFDAESNCGENRSAGKQLKFCLQHRQFRKLLTVRLLSQTGDGVFQAGLAALFFFRPEVMATAGQVALAFAVLLLPFTIVGPFAGPLLDRWHRRQVLCFGNLLRTGLASLLAILIYFAPDAKAIYVLALITLGVNRFLLSALSAGLPHTLPKDLLLMANSIVPTLGAGAAVAGALLGLLVNRLAPPGGIRNAIALLLAALLFLTASLAARRFTPDALGPDADDLRRANTRSLAREFCHLGQRIYSGARYLLQRGTPAYALGIMAIHRFLYGVNFLALLLIARNLLSDPRNADAGLAIFAFTAGISFFGGGLAVILTPAFGRILSPARWIICCLLVSFCAQLLLVFTYHPPFLYISAALGGLGAQGAKIAVDTIVQKDTADIFRGRAFALYDMLYNSAFVAAALTGALFLPDTGFSPLVFSLLASIYILAALWYWRKVSQLNEAPRLLKFSLSDTKVQ